MVAYPGCGRYGYTRRTTPSHFGAAVSVLRDLLEDIREGRRSVPEGVATHPGDGTYQGVKEAPYLVVSNTFDEVADAAVGVGVRVQLQVCWLTRQDLFDV